jgi:phage terminase large subunit-like protein
VADLDEILKTLKALDDRKTFQRIHYFTPYPKQSEFFAMGSKKRERLLMAGNQLGKSEAGAYETACHLTGIYPEWWTGRRWDRPTRGWAAGPTSLLVRDVAQKKLCGEPGVVAALGTGMIPKHLIVDVSLARGVTDAYDTIQVRHVSGGISVLKFKSYEQGRAKFQGETIDFAWDDEEPPQDIYTEILTRTNATAGMVYITFTPLLGMSDVVIQFIQNPTPDRGLVTMTIDDVTHISPELKAQIIASYPPHEREARVKGVPMLGSGRIFPYTEESVTEPDLAYVPPHWTKLWGTDFGIGTDHPFAAVLTAWDRDNDVIHVLATVRVSDQLPANHATAMKPIGAAVPVAWPHDGINREKGSGEELANQYRKTGLVMLHEHAKFPDGSISTEAGVAEMQQRFVSGRLKIAASLSMLLDEYRMYHRKDGLIVKTRDDLMSALRIAIMAKRFGRAVQLGGKLKTRRAAVADGVDFDLF